MKHSKTLLAPLQKQMLYIITALLWVTGAIWMVLLETDPARPLWMKLHGAAAMAFLVILGTVMLHHVPAGWKQNDQRPSGGSLLIVCGVLVISGWGLYYLGNEEWRHWTRTIHSIIGLLLPVILFLHVWLAKKNKVS